MSYEKAWLMGNQDDVEETAEEKLQLKRFGSLGQFISSLRLFLEVSEQHGLYDVHKTLTQLPEESVRNLPL